MVSKKEKKRWKKYIESQAFILDVHVTQLMYQELLFERKVRRKAVRMSKKRKVGDYIK